MRYVLALTFLTVSTAAFALEPADIWILVNKNVPESRQVADHYIAKRGVPKTNVIELDLPKGEDISRADYDTKLAEPVRVALKDKKDAAKVLLSTYGVPLRVGGQPSDAEETKELKFLRPDLDIARKKLVELEKKDREPQLLDSAHAELYRRHKARLESREKILSHSESHACVDSELMLLWWPKYPLERWVMNPLYFQASERYRKATTSVVMTSRLDGPTVDIAKRLVDDAIAVEAKGLAGDVVIDSRGIPFTFNPKSDTGHGYGGYDESMREAAKLLEAGGRPVAVMGWRILHDIVHGRHLYIDDLVVTANARSQGWGARFLEHAENQARSLGCQGLRLCTGVQNTAAIKFYERQGWAPRAFALKKSIT